MIMIRLCLKTTGCVEHRCRLMDGRLNVGLCCIRKYNSIG